MHTESLAKVPEGIVEKEVEDHSQSNEAIPGIGVGKGWCQRSGGRVHLFGDLLDHDVLHLDILESEFIEASLTPGWLVDLRQRLLPLLIHGVVLDSKHWVARLVGSELRDGWARWAKGIVEPESPWPVEVEIVFL